MRTAEALGSATRRGSCKPHIFPRALLAASSAIFCDTLPLSPTMRPGVLIRPEGWSGAACVWPHRRWDVGEASTQTQTGQRSHPRAGERRRTTAVACGDGGRRFWAGQPGIREQWSANDEARSLPRALPVSSFPIPRRAPGCALGACPLRDGIAFVDIKTQRDGCAQARVDDNLVGCPFHRTLCARRDVT